MLVQPKFNRILTIETVTLIAFKSKAIIGLIFIYHIFISTIWIDLKFYHGTQILNYTLWEKVY